MSREPATHHIQQILLGIQQNLTYIGENNEFADIQVSLEHPVEEVDSEKFNRAYVTIDGHRYAISVFVPGGDGSNDQEELDMLKGTVFELTEDMQVGSPFKFHQDHRVSNPKLHQLYVGWARESLQVAHKACLDLWDQSRWPASDLASRLWIGVCQHIRTDAAWFEAAVLEFMEPGGTAAMTDFTVYAGESLRNLPPGEYSGHIEEKDGKLFFELSDAVMAKGD